MDNNYTPVSCSLYDGLETFIVGRKKIELVFLNAENSEVETECVITDLFSKDKAEFIRLDNGSEVRLDKILKIDGVQYSKKC